MALIVWALILHRPRAVKPLDSLEWRSNLPKHCPPSRQGKADQDQLRASSEPEQDQRGSVCRPAGAQVLGEISHPATDKGRYGSLAESSSYQSTWFPWWPCLPKNLEKLTDERNVGTKYSGETDGLERYLGEAEWQMIHHSLNAPRYSPHIKIIYYGDLKQ